MNAAILGVIVLGVFALGYRYYGKKIEQLWEPDPTRLTPAKEFYDGIDYVPARHWSVLFGHHFSSIAGAAPIIGPVIAVAIWGWGMALIWIVLGSIFMGAVHDYGSLMASVRHRGVSIANLASEVISRRAYFLFSIFVWLALILVVSVFIIFSAKTYVAEPKIVIPSMGLVPVAIIIGVLLYRLKINQLKTTLIGLSLLAGLMIAGTYLPIDLKENGQFIWSLVLIGYCFFASVTPVQILLQPRDYLCAFLLFFGLFMGYLGLMISHPQINIPAFITLKGSKGYLWPMLFVTIACGAISGFHSLIASGTTSKQIASEKDAKKIGYGGMIAEGVLAALALLVVSSGLGGLDRLTETLAPGGPGPIGAFAEGYQNVTRPILGNYGGLISITILNAFVLTTLDTATRITRYLTQELFGIKNRYLATLIIVGISGWLAMSGNWDKIWPIFGASNQLVAALSLIVISSWLLSRKKDFRPTIFPAVLILVTAVGALAYQLYTFILNGEYFLTIVASVLIILAVLVCIEAIHIYGKIRKRSEQKILKMQ